MVKVPLAACAQIPWQRLAEVFVRRATPDELHKHARNLHHHGCWRSARDRTNGQQFGRGAGDRKPSACELFDQEACHLLDVG